MGLEKKIIAGNREDADSILQEMQNPIIYNLKKPEVEPALFGKIPFLSRFVKPSSESGDHALQMGAALSSLQGASSSVAGGLHFASISLATIDFFMIPMAYLSAFILDEPVPFKLNNNVRWLYSATVLGLGITALAVPAAAPPIGLAIGCLALAASVVLLTKALYERYTLGRQKKALKKEINGAEEEMRLIQNEAMQLQKRLAEAKETEHLQDIYRQIAKLQEDYQAQRDKIQGLKEDELAVDEKLKKLGALQIADKGVGVSLASLAVVGLALTLVFPHVGLLILAGAAAAGLTYLAARLTIPLAISAGKWAINKFRNASGESDELQDANTNKLAEQHELEFERSLGPTAVAKKTFDSDVSEAKRQKLDTGVVLEPSISVESGHHHDELTSTSAILELLGDKEAVLASFKHGQTDDLDDGSLLDETAVESPHHNNGLHEKKDSKPKEQDDDSDSEGIDDGEHEDPTAFVSH